MEKKGMEKKKSTRKTLRVILNVVLWLFVAFSVLVTVVVVSASTNKKNVPVIGGLCFLNVQTNSMDAPKPADVPAGKPSGFSAGSLLVGRYVFENAEAIGKLGVGDVITFERDLNGDGTLELNTHRIVGLTEDGKGFYTKGDNNERKDGGFVSFDAVIAVYEGVRVPVVGAVLTFLGTQLGFGLCILLPLLAFFVFQLVSFIRTVLSIKNEGKKLISAADEELIKQRAVEEYLRRQAEAASSAPAETAPADTAPAETAEAPAEQNQSAGE